MDHSNSSPDARPPSFWRSRSAIAFIVMGAVATWYLWAEHRAHLLGALPYLILLACPLMHVFMHRGHHGGHHDHDKGERQ
ncbi:MAG: DUF2933 domain-containing protein [Burkholderiales bacterium]|nr:DUF2933 domain-containing protein [Burkholderiales bacterium]